MEEQNDIVLKTDYENANWIHLACTGTWDKIL
jgi:hypothetical protein